MLRVQVGESLRASEGDGEGGARKELVGMAQGF